MCQVPSLRVHAGRRCVPLTGQLQPGQIPICGALLGLDCFFRTRVPTGGTPELVIVRPRLRAGLPLVRPRNPFLALVGATVIAVVSAWQFACLPEVGETPTGLALVDMGWNARASHSSSSSSFALLILRPR